LHYFNADQLKVLRLTTEPGRRQNADRDAPPDRPKS
jgi:hypothetical protein